MWTPMLVCTKKAANPMDTSNQKVLVRMASLRVHESSSLPSGLPDALVRASSGAVDGTAPSTITRSGGTPSGRRPMSSGRSATKNRDGATETASTIRPMVIQVAFNP